MTYDANGNVSSIAPPGRPAHAFTYTPLDLEQSYTPPSLGSTTPTTTTSSYQLDEQLSSISRPDGDVVSTSYDTAGRLASVSSAARIVTTSYDPLTGNLASLSAPDFGSLRYAYDGALPTDTTWSGVINWAASPNRAPTAPTARRPATPPPSPGVTCTA